MVKFKSRYILIELKFENERKIQTLDPGKLIVMLKNKVQHLFGDIGLGKINKNLQVKYVNNVTNLVIIRVSRNNLKLMWTTLSLMNELEGETVRMQVIGVSGTIKKIELKAKEMLEKWLNNYENNN
jgi:RNase P/RNase MRP subunit POP5